MNTLRLSSLDPVKIPNWRWAPFLNHAIKSLAPLNPEPYPIPQEFLKQEGDTGSKSQPIKVTTCTWACKTNKLRQARAACVEADSSASVLNFVINPYCTYDLPFFGADLVTLPSGHLLALDLQPAITSDEKHTKQVWERLMPLFEHWSARLPKGGPIPEEAKRYFSPGFIWTRLPLGSEGNKLIDEVITPAFSDYLSLYLDLVKAAVQVPPERAVILLEGQKQYMNYRAQKDPARAMLTRFHGSKWTEAYIHKVLFDL